jgi:hypothetical protein
MFDENSGISETSTCTGSFCPIGPEQLESLLIDEDTGDGQGEDLPKPTANLSEQDFETETRQTLRYLEDRVIAMGEQLDRLVDSSSSTELSAIAHSYSLIEPEKAISKLKLVEPETQPVRKHFEGLAQKPHPSIIECFLDLQKKLLIVIDSDSHEISLLFAFRPSGPDFEPIKALCLHECSWLMKQFRPSEFRFGFAKICDLKAIAWSVVLAYRELGYSCRIECGGEAIEVDELIAEAEPSALWASMREVALCA